MGLLLSSAQCQMSQQLPAVAVASNTFGSQSILPAFMEAKAH
jgi:hypothetical protein